MENVMYVIRIAEWTQIDIYVFTYKLGFAISVSLTDVIVLFLIVIMFALNNILVVKKCAWDPAAVVWLQHFIAVIWFSLC